MKNDLYMKTILTVIAISLSVIALENMNLWKDAQAYDHGPVHVIVDNVNSTAIAFPIPVQVQKY